MSEPLDWNNHITDRQASNHAMGRADAALAKVVTLESDMRVLIAEIMALRASHADLEALLTQALLIIEAR